ncbi:hypothetical protein [Nocardioides hwasunensis]|uniref:Uncharacterized protein n=1 Tax=Nocardioides hwasunensis TaxID=397258 RepID=A0ABR8MHD0_9ACTN|nr:hypothetical protein [Nocardioides hwasunensis]MBD3913504.1 hypothetical protein [Nocardioides hwasunensis]
MKLHEQLERELDSHDRPDIDVQRLSHVARGQGTRALRRRRVVSGIACAAAVAATAVGVDALAVGPDQADVAGEVVTAVSPAVPDAFDPSAPGPSAPATGRGVAAALWWAVTDLQAGTATNFGGQAGHEWHASLEWDAADGEGTSQLDVNVQNDMPFGDCRPDKAVVDCQVSTLADGSILKTYEQRTAADEEVGIARIVQLRRTDNVQVSVSATNGLSLAGGGWDVRRSQPPLTMEELTELAAQPFWGPDLPTVFMDAGQDLVPYRAQGTPWPNMTAR